MQVTLPPGSEKSKGSGKEPGKEPGKGPEPIQTLAGRSGSRESHRMLVRCRIFAPSSLHFEANSQASALPFTRLKSCCAS